MTDSNAASGAATDAGHSEPAMYRLVIRAEILPEEPLQATTTRPKFAIAWVVGAAIAVLALSWLAVSALRPEAPAAPVATEAARTTEPRAPTSAARDVVPVSAPVTDAPKAPIEETVAAGPSSQPAAAPQTNTPAVSINEVLPTAPQSALQTIRGTVRVLVRVTIDKQGAVVASVAEDAGPSRYFERLSLEASRKWTFAPATADEPRHRLLRFSFTREGVAARAEPAG